MEKSLQFAGKHDIMIGEDKASARVELACHPALEDVVQCGP